MAITKSFIKVYLLLVLASIIALSTLFTAKGSAWSDNLHYSGCTGSSIWSSRSLYDSSGRYVGFARLYNCSNGYMFVSANRSTYGYIYTEVNRSGNYPNKLTASRNGYGTQTNMLYRAIGGTCVNGGATAGRWTSLPGICS